MLFLLIVGAVLAAAAAWVYAGLTGAGAGIGLVVGIGILILVGLGVALATRWLRRLSEPVDDLVEAAARIAAGDYTARVDERGPREVRALAHAFNQMTERLAATEGERRTFIADVTHELRTPLAVIRGHTEGITDGVYPGDAEHVTPILDATHALERLVDDLRTLSLSESGSLELRREPVDVGELATDVLDGVRPEAEAAGVRLELVIADGLPVVAADPARIRQVLANLLANALRYTPSAGSVRVAVSEDGNAAEPAVGISISVHDSGPGFAPDVLPRAFDRFARAPGSPGAGLGLAIARDLVAAHGGTIEARNPPGGGAEVRFTLPSTRSPVPAA